MQQALSSRTNSHFPTVKATASEKHERALGLYAGGQFESAVELLRQAMLEAPSSELANDFGAAELACGRREQALSQFFLATSLDPENIEAVANLGMLLAHVDRTRDAVPYLQKASFKTKDPAQRLAIEKLLADCGNRTAERVLQEARSATPQQAFTTQPAVAPAIRPPIYMGNNIALLCTTNYNKMFVDTRDLLIAPWLLIHGEWEPEETDLVKKLVKLGDVFVDVGANLGYYSLIAARAGASHVYAFEAQPSTYELLGKNVIINWMTKFITYENLAVYSHTTDLEFFVRNHYPGNSSLGFAPPDQLGKWFDTTTAVKVHAVCSMIISRTNPAKSICSRWTSKAQSRPYSKARGGHSHKTAESRFSANGARIRWRRRVRIQHTLSNFGPSRDSGPTFFTRDSTRFRCDRC